MPTDIGNFPPSGLDLEDHWKRVAAGRLGLTPTNVAFDFDDYFRWNADPWLDATGGSGAQNQANPSTTENNGVFQITSGATAASFRRQHGGKVVSNTKTKKWMVVVRMAITTAKDAQSKVGFGISDANAAANAYVIGNRANDANFGVYHGADFEAGAPTQLSLGVAFDNVFHTFEAWCLGDNVLRARIDGGAEVSVTPAATIASPELFRVAANGTTAAARTLQLDWHLYFGERA